MILTTKKTITQILYLSKEKRFKTFLALPYSGKFNLPLNFFNQFQNVVLFPYIKCMSPLSLPLPYTCYILTQPQCHTSRKNLNVLLLLLHTFLNIFKNVKHITATKNLNVSIQFAMT